MTAEPASRRRGKDEGINVPEAHIGELRLSVDLHILSERHAMTESCVVIGGTGYIGTHPADDLAGHKASCACGHNLLRCGAGPNLTYLRATAPVEFEQPHTCDAISPASSHSTRDLE